MSRKSAVDVCARVSALILRLSIVVSVSAMPLLPTGPVVTAAVAATARSPLQASQFSYLGSFKLPDNTTFGDTSSGGRSLAVRIVNGNVDLFITGMSGAWGTPMYLAEVQVPPQSQWNGTTVAATVRDWSNSQANNVFALSGYTVGCVGGLYWDAVDSRLWYAFTSGDCTDYTSATYGTVAYLDGGGTALPAPSAGGSIVAHGPWSLGSNWKQADSGVFGLPADFVQQYLGGDGTNSDTNKRLAGGFGGVRSIAGTGGTSYGPSALAFAPGSLGSAGSVYTPKPLVGYPYGGSVPGCNRPDTILDDYVQGDTTNDPCQNPQTITDCPYNTSSYSYNFYNQGNSVTGSSRNAWPTAGNSTTITSKHPTAGMAYWAEDNVAGVPVRRTDQHVGHGVHDEPSDRAIALPGKQRRLGQWRSERVDDI